MRVAFTPRAEPGRSLVAREGRDAVEQLPHGDWSTTAHMQDLPRAPVDCRKVGGRNVLCIDKVARLRTIAIDHDLVARQHALNEDSDNAALLRGGVLATAVDVCVPQNCVVEPERSLVLRQVELKRGLTHTVRR